MTVSPSISASLPRRLKTYLDERFPLVGNGVLVALLCAGSILAFGAPGTRPMLDALIAFAAILPIFLIMRVADEHKDYADDAAFRPERPVPRGLVSLGELRMFALVAGAVPLALALLFSPVSLVPLLAVALWIGAMSVEFGVRDWLRARPVIYLVSHMLVMPLLALLAVSFSARTASDLYTVSLMPVLALAFAAGIVLEIGRKLWGTDEEREGVETYSRLWGTALASHVFSAIALGALVLATALAGWHILAIVIAMASGVAVVLVSARYRARPEASRAKPLRMTAILVVAIVYSLCIAGAFLDAQ